MTLHRAQILLDKDQHAQLERLARGSGRSISEIVREMMDEYLTRVSEDEEARRSLAAIDQLSVLRQRIERRHGRLDASLLDGLREERDEEIAPRDRGTAP